MGSIKVNFHPLFFLFGFYYALTGRIFVFIIYTLTCLIHELGHSFVAEIKGYKLNKITLMPFGAVISCGKNDLNIKDQTAIALAGPFINIIIALIFISFWWIYPESYAFTDTAVEANLTMAIINLIPVFPLDGGRIMYSILALKINKQKAKLYCKILGVILSVTLIGLFIYSAFNTLNLSLLFFSLFILIGVIKKDDENVYVKLYTGLNSEALKRGVEVKNIAVSPEISIRGLVRILDADKLNEVLIVNDGEVITRLSQTKLLKIIEKGDINSPIKKYL